MIVGHLRGASATMSQVSSVHGNHAFVASAASRPYPIRVVRVTISVFVITTIASLFRDAVKRLHDANRVSGLARDVDGVSLDETVVVV